MYINWIYNPPLGNRTCSPGSGNCIQTCEDITCAPKASCKINANGPTCVCHGGYQGDPNPGGSGCYPLVFSTEATILSSTETTGRATCEQDEDCGGHLSCMEGICKDPCLNLSPCGKGAKCFVELHRPVCVCPKDYVGDPQNECKGKNLLRACAPSWLTTITICFQERLLILLYSLHCQCNINIDAKYPAKISSTLFLY